MNCYCYNIVLFFCSYIILILILFLFLFLLIVRARALLCLQYSNNGKWWWRRWWWRWMPLPSFSYSRLAFLLTTLLRRIMQNMLLYFFSSSLSLPNTTLSPIKKKCMQLKLQLHFLKTSYFPHFNVYLYV